MQEYNQLPLYWKKLSEKQALDRIVDEPFYEKYRNRNSRDTKITYFCKKGNCQHRFRNTVHVYGIIIWEETEGLEHTFRYTKEEKDKIKIKEEITDMYLSTHMSPREMRSLLTEKNLIVSIKKYITLYLS